MHGPVCICPQLSFCPQFLDAEHLYTYLCPPACLPACHSQIFCFGEYVSQNLSWCQPNNCTQQYTSTVYSDDSTPVCKTGMDITVNPELPGMNIFIHLDE